MHVLSCCFVNLNLLFFFYVFVAVAQCHLNLPTTFVCYRLISVVVSVKITETLIFSNSVFVPLTQRSHTIANLSFQAELFCITTKNGRYPRVFTLSSLYENALNTINKRNIHDIDELIKKSASGCESEIKELNILLFYFCYCFKNLAWFKQHFAL